MKGLGKQLLLRWTNLIALWMAEASVWAPIFVAALPSDMLRSVLRTEAWFGITMLAFVLTLQGMEAAGINLRTARMLLAIMIPASAVPWLMWFYGLDSESVSVRRAFLLGSFLVILWWRAISIHQRENFYLTAEREFSFGLLLLLLGGSIFFWKGLGNLWPNTVIFIFGSLTSLSVSKLLEESAAEKEAVQRFGLRHAVTIFLSVMIVLTTGWLLSNLYSLKTFDLLWRVSGGLFLLLGRWLEAMLFLILPAIFAPFEFISRRIEFSLPTPERMEEPFPLTTPAPAHGGFLSSLSWMVPYATIVLLAALILLFLVLMLRRKPENEQTEVIPAKKETGAGPASHLGLFDRFSDLLEAVRSFGFRRGLLDAISIQNIYANLQRAASTRGYARAPWETPYEYLPKLKEAFPGQDREVESITEAYVTVYYGEKRVSAEMLDSAKESWRRIMENMHS